MGCDYRNTRVNFEISAIVPTMALATLIQNVTGSRSHALLNASGKPLKNHIFLTSSINWYIQRDERERLERDIIEIDHEKQEERHAAH